ncbi:hypothetical protein FB451DRAFT_289493 [Mycena latifolia]|nr:hypothetical protein FB451DRAFT_289493 [Mycena latifolia]
MLRRDEVVAGTLSSPPVRRVSAFARASMTLVSTRGLACPFCPAASLRHAKYRSAHGRPPAVLYLYPRPDFHHCTSARRDLLRGGRSDTPIAALKPPPPSSRRLLRGSDIHGSLCVAILASRLGHIHHHKLRTNAPRLRCFLIKLAAFCVASCMRRSAAQFPHLLDLALRGLPTSCEHPWHSPYRVARPASVAASTRPFTVGAGFRARASAARPRRRCTRLVRRMDVELAAHGLSLRPSRRLVLHHLRHTAPTSNLPLHVSLRMRCPPRTCSRCFWKQAWCARLPQIAVLRRRARHSRFGSPSSDTQTLSARVSCPHGSLASAHRSISRV